MASCTSEELTSGNNGQTNGEPTDERQLVDHEVSVTLDGSETRVGFTGNGGGLQLAWEADETLGVYIRKTDNSIIYAGTVSSNGTAGDRGTRTFTGTVSQKNTGEQYIYIHPALTEGAQGTAATGEISFTTESGSLGSTSHLKNYIPIIWNEGESRGRNCGYAVHLQLTFNEDPGTISKITLHTMADAGETYIFPATFEASTMGAGDAKNTEVALSITSGTAGKVGSKWTTDAYIACCNLNANVFRTKYNIKVDAANGTFYNEYRSFPGQENATETLPMLANGKCYNLATVMTKDVATTIINSTYKINSLLGMWNQYGKSTDPFGLKIADANNTPSQLKSNILDNQPSFTARTMVGTSSQGSPTFTWDMVTKQVAGNSDGYKQRDVTYNNIEIVNAPTEVYVTFISEYAWSQNLLGYYHYTTGKLPASSNEVLKTIIFPNVSKGGHVPYNKDGIDGGANINPNTAVANVGTPSDAPLAEYTTVQLLYNKPDGSVSKTFPVGTTIGFFMMRDPKASSSGHDEGSMGDTSDDTHSGYQPRTDNTLLDWTSWRLFTNTAWNGSSGNTGWWDSNCWNFFCSADVGSDSSGTLIPGLALYGAKDDASHNYNYSFSAMLYMVSTSNPGSIKTENKAYFNLGSGDVIINK